MYQVRMREMEQKVKQLEQECSVERVVDLKRLISDLSIELDRAKKSTDQMKQEYVYLKSHMESNVAVLSAKLSQAQRAQQQSLQKNRQQQVAAQPMTRPQLSASSTRKPIGVSSFVAA
jgi:hypothetical protein